MELVKEFEKKIRKKELEIEMFKRSELLEKYIVKILFEQNDRKLEDKYLKKLERSWMR